MKLLNTLLLAFCCTLLIACGDDAAESLANNTKTNAPKPKIENPFSDQLKALDKVKNLESEMNEAVQNKLKALDEMTK